MQEEIVSKVKNGTINKCCIKCADKYRVKESYNGTYTFSDRVCDICKENKMVANASKLFGYHSFI